VDIQKEGRGKTNVEKLCFIKTLLSGLCLVMMIKKIKNAHLENTILCGWWRGFIHIGQANVVAGVDAQS
jgi:hypothetical protein